MKCPVSRRDPANATGQVADAPKPPADTETTLAKLQKRAAAEIVAAAKPEAEKLARKVDATVAAIREELAKP